VHHRCRSGARPRTPPWCRSGACPRTPPDRTGVGPGLVPGRLPGVGPGLVPGRLPGVGPGLVPGRLPGVGPGLVPGRQAQPFPPSRRRALPHGISASRTPCRPVVPRSDSPRAPPHQVLADAGTCHQPARKEVAPWRAHSAGAETGRFVRRLPTEARAQRATSHGLPPNEATGIPPTRRSGRSPSHQTKRPESLPPDEAAGLRAGRIASAASDLLQPRSPTLTPPKQPSRHHSPNPQPGNGSRSRTTQ